MAGAPLRRIGRDDDMAGCGVPRQPGGSRERAISRSTEDRHDGEWNLSLSRAGSVPLGISRRQQPGVLEGGFLPPFVAATGATVAAAIWVQQHRVPVGLGMPQGGNPFRWLNVEHPGVAERRHRQDRRVLLGPRSHMANRTSCRSRRRGPGKGFPLVPLGHRQRQRRIEDGGQRVDERHGRQHLVNRCGAMLATAPISRPPALPPRATRFCGRVTPVSMR